MSGSNNQKPLAEPRLIEASLQKVHQRLERMQNLKQNASSAPVQSSQATPQKVPVESA